MTYVLDAAVVLLAIGSAVFTSAPLQADTIPGSVLACTKQSDKERRLACYDAEIAKFNKANSPEPAAVAGSDSDTRPLVNDFGVENGPLARQRQDHIPKTAELTARVVNVAKRTDQLLMISLDNGQVWQQTRTESYFPLRPDDVVTINSGLMGVYWLTAPSGRVTKVRRIK